MVEQKRKSGLGRGLSALMDEELAASPARTSLPIADIIASPNQPRRRFDADAMDELTTSVRERGILQPILVRPVANGRFEVVAGERRWRAAGLAQLHEIPVVICELDDATAFEIALVENIQRADLNPIEEAEGFQRLMIDHGHTQESLAKIVGKARSHVANLLRLLELPVEIRDFVANGELAMGHAKALMSSADPYGLAFRAINEGLSVRQVEALGRKPQRTRSKSKKVDSDDADLAVLNHRLSEALGITVVVAASVPPGGTVTIAFATLDQLDLLCRVIEAAHVSKPH